MAFSIVGHFSRSYCLSTRDNPCTNKHTHIYIYISIYKQIHKFMVLVDPKSGGWSSTPWICACPWRCSSPSWPCCCPPSGSGGSDGLGRSGFEKAKEKEGEQKMAIQRGEQRRQRGCWFFVDPSHPAISHEAEFRSLERMGKLPQESSAVTGSRAFSELELYNQHLSR